MGENNSKLHSHILNTVLDELGQGVYGAVFVHCPGAEQEKHCTLNSEESCDGQ